MTEQERPELVARWYGGYWSLCHANSYQNAFRATVNKFNTRGDAVKFASENGFKVVKHSHDILQNY